MNSKEKAILDRITFLEAAIAKGREYLEAGKHADWSGFRPLFAEKVRDGKVLPPHKDWVQNVFLPRHERALRKAHKSLERVTSVGRSPANQTLEAERRAHAGCNQTPQPPLASALRWALL